MVSGAGFVATRGAAGIGRHGHQSTGEHELHLFTEADGWFHNGPNRLRIQGSTLVYSLPDLPHALESRDERTECRFYFLRFSPEDQSASIVSRIAALFPCDRPRSPAHRYIPVFEDIRRKHGSRNPDSRASADHLLMALLFELAAESTPGSQVVRHPAVERLVRTMQANIYGTLSLDTCARDLRLSKPYLVRRFRAEMGAPPLQYYQRLKMDTARHLLRTTTEPIYMIAQRLRYWDEFHFSRTFRKYVGVPPREYRESLNTNA